MFVGKLIFSYLAVKAVSFGKVTISGVILLFSTIFPLILLFLPLLGLRPQPKNLPIIGLAIFPQIGAPIDTSSPKGIAPPVCYLFSNQYIKHLLLHIVYLSF